MVIPYFGKLPPIADYFLESAGYARDLDVLLFTDAPPKGTVPANVKVHAFTLAGFNALASRTLGISVQLPTPFKLCDFKPTYGIVFQEYLRDYGFWGFGDLDVIYGDVAHFLAPLVEDQDIISCRKAWISGSLCVLRNCPKVNSAYTNSADWERVLATPGYQGFDELGGDNCKDAFTHVAKRLQGEGALRCSFRDLACEGLAWGDTLVYDHGKITRCRDGAPVMYVHTVVMKRRFFYLPDGEGDRSRLYIRNTGVYPVGGSVSGRYIREVGRVFRGGASCFARLIRRVSDPRPHRHGE
jgi:hypothetical protein